MQYYLLKHSWPPDLPKPVWLEWESSGKRARWVRADGSLIREWRGAQLGPVPEPSVNRGYVRVSRPGSTEDVFEYLQMDEGF